MQNGVSRMKERPEISIYGLVFTPIKNYHDIDAGHQFSSRLYSTAKFVFSMEHSLLDVQTQD